MGEKRGRGAAQTERRCGDPVRTRGAAELPGQARFKMVGNFAEGSLAEGKGTKALKKGANFVFPAAGQFLL